VLSFGISYLIVVPVQTLSACMSVSLLVYYMLGQFQLRPVYVLAYLSTTTLAWTISLKAGEGKHWSLKKSYKRKHYFPLYASTCGSWVLVLDKNGVIKTDIMRLASWNQRKIKLDNIVQLCKLRSKQHLKYLWEYVKIKEHSKYHAELR